MFKNKSLLVTGGTGSFGSSVVKKFVKSDIGEIIVFSRDEKKQEDMRIKYSSNKLKFFLGDVRDYESIFKATKNVDYIFHAAALKQVPSCEFFPMEAVKTNILGTENVLNAAISNNVKKSIFLSTDKAVYPINAMGYSKAMMEKLVFSKSNLIKLNKIKLLCTRYGNVLATRGSVIPLIIDQIKSNRDITITNPNMTRFLISLEESIELILYAFKNGSNGDIFVKKSSSSTIMDIAKVLKDIFNSKNKIKIIGTRHGEKLHEVLVSREEKLRCIENKSFYRILPDHRNLNYNSYTTRGDKKLENISDYNSEKTDRLTLKQLKSKLLKLDYIKKELND